MEFHYSDSFGSDSCPQAYERLLLDALHGDAALFTRGLKSGCLEADRQHHRRLGGEGAPPLPPTARQLGPEGLALSMALALLDRGLRGEHGIGDAPNPMQIGQRFACNTAGL